MAGESQARRRSWRTTSRRHRARASPTSTSSRGLVGGACKTFPSPRERCRRGRTRCTTEGPARVLLWMNSLEPTATGRKQRGIFVSKQDW
ncbi:hypothetical protein C2845_PM02G40050 [Panicum miliaceum]|uniref:Uncharacterized protein n=1 Tax=Panicum miliaceum TaxID=4540 RepID=A0A3L6S793_PANMI|nr:hypothetical protein C2845_PM02G40050 [Panicum miliaceum]